MSLKSRQNPMPDAIAHVPQIPIAGILTPALPDFGKVFPHFYSPSPEERPHN
jgi:hypothetical protein